VKVVNNFLHERTFNLKIGGFISKSYPQANSVPQGSVLGRLLFAAFINDLSESLEIPFLLYADDLVLYFQDINIDVILSKLNSTLSRVHDWSMRNQISINVDKTEFMIFLKRGELLPPFANPTLNGHELVRVNNFKY